MKTFGSVDAVLDFAIEREQEAVDFYIDLAGQTEIASLKKTLQAFAGVERGHKEKLQKARLDSAVVDGNRRVVDLKIGDYMVPVEAGPTMSFQDALVLAMQREKAAMELYTDLAGVVEEAGLRALFEKLAAEEAQHKFSFEAIYENHFLSEN